MKRKFELSKQNLIKLGLLLLLLALLPFSFELVFLIDIGGLDLAISFLALSLGSLHLALLEKLDKLKRDVSAFLFFYSEPLYVQTSHCTSPRCW